MNQTISIKTPYHSILESCTWNDIVNGYFGSSNLFCDYLNDYSSRSVNSEIAEFLQENAKHLDKSDIEMILENPDAIINNAAYEFYQALTCIFDGDGNRAEYAIRNANHWFDSWGAYFVFVNVDMACLYIIRASNVESAFAELVTRFESAFVIDESDVENDDEQERNDNGNPINVDYLRLLGEIKFVKP